jgi:hypothetical protein
MQARCYGSMWMVAVTRGTWPTTRMVGPCPVRSSAIFTSPGPGRWVVLSRRRFFAALDRVLTDCRRGAVRQSRNVPGGVEQNATPVAPWRAVHSEWDARSSSSRCDSPSSPVYKRTMPIETPPPDIVVFCRSPAEVSDPGEPVLATVGRRRRGTPPLPPHGHGYCSPCVRSRTPGDGHRSAPEHRTQSIHATRCSWQAPPAPHPERLPALRAPCHPPPRSRDPLMRATPPV